MKLKLFFIVLLALLASGCAESIVAVPKAVIVRWSQTPALWEPCPVVCIDDIIVALFATSVPSTFIQ